jgi:hypothetical protein
MMLTRRAVLLAFNMVRSTARLPFFASAFSTTVVGVASFVSRGNPLRQFHCFRNFSPPSLFHASNNQESFGSTWTYTPYNPNESPPRRNFSSWTVPKTIDIPTDKLDIQFVRSSGAGGQNVNKVNTQVHLRMVVDEATWIPEEVRERLKEQQANKINKDGVLTLNSQEYRTQAQNKKDVLGKLKAAILEAWPRPKIRKQRTGISNAAKERNKEFKKKRSQTKQSRRNVSDW